MALNDTLLSVIRVLYIVFLVVLIYTAVQGALFVKETRAIMTDKLQSGELFADIAAASGEQLADRFAQSAEFGPPN